MEDLVIGAVFGILLTFVVLKLPYKPAAKVKVREGMMTLDQYVKLHRLSGLPKNGVYDWMLKYSNYDPEIIQSRLFPEERIKTDE